MRAMWMTARQPHPFQNTHLQLVWEHLEKRMRKTEFEEEEETEEEDEVCAMHIQSPIA